MSDKQLFRRNSILLSDEVLFYARLKCKELVAHTDATMTVDQLIDNLARKELTQENPDWVVLWSEMETAKQGAIKLYREIEARAFQGVETVSD